MAAGVQLACPLCDAPGGLEILRRTHWRVVRANEDGWPAFYRVVWNAHVAEFSDLSPRDRVRCMEVVATVERVLREHLAPTKVNLASLGNLVAHLHWHVIARFSWDSHYPQPVWGERQRDDDANKLAEMHAARPALEQALLARLSGIG